MSSYGDAAGTRLALLLQGFGIVMLGLCVFLVWGNKGNEFMDGLTFAMLDPEEVITPLLLTAAAMLLLGAHVVVHALRTIVEPYAVGPNALVDVRRLVLDVLGYLLITSAAVVAAGGPARARAVVGVLVLWHLVLLVGQALPPVDTERAGQRMLGHSAAVVVYLALVALLTLFDHGLRIAWWIGLVVLLLAAVVSMPVLWRTLPRPKAAGD